MENPHEFFEIKPGVWTRTAEAAKMADNRYEIDIYSGEHAPEILQKRSEITEILDREKMTRIIENDDSETTGDQPLPLTDDEIEEATDPGHHTWIISEEQIDVNKGGEVV